MRLIYAIAFAVFFVAVPMGSPAQSLDLSLLSARVRLLRGHGSPCDALSAGEGVAAVARCWRFEYRHRRPDDDDKLYFVRRPRRRAGWLNSAPGTKTRFDPSNEQLDTIRFLRSSSSSLTSPPKRVGAAAADDITTTGPSAQSIPVASRACRRQSDRMRARRSWRTRHRARGGGRGRPRLYRSAMLKGIRG